MLYLPELYRKIIKREFGDGSREALREKYGIGKDEMVLVYVGRMAKEKNIEELLWYPKKCTRQCKTCLVGDGPYRETLEMKAKEYGVEQSVIFTGMVSPKEVAGYYQIGRFICQRVNQRDSGNDL